MLEPLIVFHPFIFEILKHFLSDGKWREKIQKREKNWQKWTVQVSLLRFSYSNEVAIILKKKNYTTYSYSFTIKKNHLNNNALYIIISNDTFYEKYSC